MPILPVDLQALVLRMDDITRVQQAQQEGIAIAQVIKGSEFKELSQIESSRVNQLKPTPEGKSKIEDEQRKEKRSSLPARGKRRAASAGKDKSMFEEPYKGKHIDTRI
mgnify:CR=1 FL=1